MFFSQQHIYTYGTHVEGSRHGPPGLNTCQALGSNKGLNHSTMNNLAHEQLPALPAATPVPWTSTIAGALHVHCQLETAAQLVQLST
jgi:hypothetical protein